MADIFDLGKTCIVFFGKEDVMSPGELIELESSKKTISVMFDIQHLQEGRYFEKMIGEDGSEYHLIHWTNPPEYLFMGSTNRYFMVSRKEYLFTPRKVNKVVVDGDDIEVTAWGKFLSLNTAVRFLKQVNILPPFTQGKYFEDLQKKRERELSLLDMIEF